MRVQKFDYSIASLEYVIDSSFSIVSCSDQSCQWNALQKIGIVF